MIVEVSDASADAKTTADALAATLASTRWYSTFVHDGNDSTPHVLISNPLPHTVMLAPPVSVVSHSKLSLSTLGGHCPDSCANPYFDWVWSVGGNQK